MRISKRNCVGIEGVEGVIEGKIHHSETVFMSSNNEFYMCKRVGGHWHRECFHLVVVRVKILHSWTCVLAARCRDLWVSVAAFQ